MTDEEPFETVGLARRVSGLAVVVAFAAAVPALALVDWLTG